jgi:hypothetical protein
MPKLLPNITSAMLRTLPNVQAEKRVANPAKSHGQPKLHKRTFQRIKKWDKTSHPPSHGKRQVHGYPAATET